VSGDSVGAVLSPGTVHLELSAVYVQPCHRDRGSGGALVEELLVRARSRGIEHVLLYTGSGDIDAVMRFYRRHGFRPWGVQMIL
jgi:ribosomal protein S18 acetylase RimI-like enzyme